MDVIKGINKIIDAYNSRYKTLTIHELLDAKSKLLTLLFSLSDTVAESKKNSLMSTVFRKVEHHKLKAQFVDDGITLGLAESKTIKALHDEMATEAERESLAVYYDLVLKAGYKIAEDITQRISVLKMEFEKSRQI